MAALTLAQPCRAAGREPAARAETYTFAFHDADIAQVAEAILGQALGVAYTVDPAVTGKISFRIDQRLTGAQLLEAFEASLESADVVMVREGDSLILKPRAKAKGAGTMRTLKEGMHGAGYETVAVPLQYAAPSEVAKALQAVTATDLVVYMDDKQGLLILGGTANELESAVQMVRLVDRSGLEDAKIRFFELEQAPAATVAGDLDRVLEASHVSGVTVVPLKRLNGLFVFARTSQAVEEVGRWIAKLDTPSKEKTAGLWVYHPKNLSAEALANTLNGVTGGVSGSTASTTSSSTTSSSTTSTLTGLSNSATASPTAAFPSSASASMGQGGGLLSTSDDPVHVAVDKDSNTLIFSASQSRWIQIQRILEEIDHAPGQVLIEASILEVTLTDQLSTGVDWSTLAAGGRLTIGAINNGGSTVAASYPGLAITYLDKNIKAAISALGEQTAVEVVSAPKIVALDNHVAKLEVGDQVPIVIQSSQSTTTNTAAIINSVDYRSTGIILDVTPRISGDDRIFLDISQEVSSVSQTTTSGIDSPTIQQRKLSTSLILENGGVIALGGLISTDRSKSNTGIPFLMNAPFIGRAFKKDTQKGNRTELIVLITAKIVKDTASSHKVMTDLLADMKEIKAHGLLP
ncbi:MAG: type II secretion system secretin GspD [Caulobacteraceae bacterium]|nr:type II secretion system secretin GspD [Caulobacteraceae bacterium]